MRRWAARASISGWAMRWNWEGDWRPWSTARRHAVGAEVLDWSRAQVALMRPDAGSRALRAIMQDLLQTRDGAAYMAGRLRGGVRPRP